MQESHADGVEQRAVETGQNRPDQLGPRMRSQAFSGFKAKRTKFQGVVDGGLRDDGTPPPRRRFERITHVDRWVVWPFLSALSRAGYKS
jgi:hypothetical protein